jgi:hypothetical protein
MAGDRGTVTRDFPERVMIAAHQLRPVVVTPMGRGGRGGPCFSHQANLFQYHFLPQFAQSAEADVF